jgi:hypothetical protein
MNSTRRNKIFSIVDHIDSINFKSRYAIRQQSMRQLIQHVQDILHSHQSIKRMTFITWRDRSIFRKYVRHKAIESLDRVKIVSFREFIMIHIHLYKCRRRYVSYEAYVDDINKTHGRLKLAEIFDSYRLKRMIFQSLIMNFIK